MNALARVSKTIPLGGKMSIFNAFIFSNLVYCSTVWHFCGLQSTRKMEKIQHRSLRYIFNDFNASYAQLRKRAHKDLLFTQRQRRILIEVFKIIHDITPEYLSHLALPHETPYDMRRTNTLSISKFKSTHYGKQSFMYEAAKLWNGVPNTMRKCNTIAQFRRALLQWEGPMCNCNVCILCILSNE